jgi:hypothetical protein
MGFFHVELKGTVSADSTAEQMRFSVNGLRSGYVASAITEVLQSRFGAKLVSEAGSGVIEERWSEFEIDGEHIQLSWAWHGISLSAKSPKAVKVLERVMPQLCQIRLNKLRLFIEEKIS